MANISEFDSKNTTRTVDDLGIKTSIDYAKAEQLRRETDKYFKPGKLGQLPAERETIQTTPTKSEELLGVVAQGRFAIFPPMPDAKTKITAFSEGRLVTSIGDGTELVKKINNAPKELKSDNAKFSIISNFAVEYTKTDKNCEHIHGRSKQYNKG